MIKQINHKSETVIINVYLTLSGEYRAYIVGKPSIQAWGATENYAVKNLLKLL